MRAADRVAAAVATGFGAGYAPFAPGSLGSLPGLLLAWGLFRGGGAWAVVAGLVVVTAAGAWAADRFAAARGERDPQVVVVDEIAGQMTALLFLVPTPGSLLAAFVAFRALDVLKPFPARRLEALAGGSGIMADDLAAGVYANLLLQAAVCLGPAWRAAG